MSRIFSAAAVRAMHAQHTALVAIPLLTLTHPSISPIRVCENTVAIVSRGNTYSPFPFRIELPHDLAEEQRPVRLVVSNVDRRLVDEVRAIADPLVVTIEIVTDVAPNTVELGPIVLDAKAAGGNAEQIELTLSAGRALLRKFPGRVFNPQDFPAIFGRVS